MLNKTINFTSEKGKVLKGKCGRQERLLGTNEWENLPRHKEVDCLEVSEFHRSINHFSAIFSPSTLAFFTIFAKLTLSLKKDITIINKKMENGKLENSKSNKQRPRFAAHKGETFFSKILIKSDLLVSCAREKPAYALMLNPQNHNSLSYDSFSNKLVNMRKKGR